MQGINNNTTAVAASSSSSVDQATTDSSQFSIGQLQVLLAAIMSKLSQVQQQAHVAQQEMGWKINQASIAQKEESIQKNFNAGITSGSLSILGGVASGVGAGFGVAGCDGAAALGTAISKGVDGIGGVASASETRSAQTAQMMSDFLSHNAQAFDKSTHELQSKYQQTLSQLTSMLSELTQLNQQVTSAVHIR